MSKNWSFIKLVPRAITLDEIFHSEGKDLCNYRVEELEQTMIDSDELEKNELCALRGPMGSATIKLTDCGLSVSGYAYIKCATSLELDEERNMLIAYDMNDVQVEISLDLFSPSNSLTGGNFFFAENKGPLLRGFPMKMYNVYDAITENRANEISDSFIMMHYLGKIYEIGYFKPIYTELEISDVIRMTSDERYDVTVTLSDCLDIELDSDMKIVINKRILAGYIMKKHNQYLEAIKKHKEYTKLATQKKEAQDE